MSAVSGPAAVPAIDINADLGESFGRWRLGDDREVMRSVSSVNIACGFHAGDPATMRESLELAASAGVAAGAHPGLPDLLGFGRRRMEVAPRDVADYVIYQVGALLATAATLGVTVTHVKPHGALYTMLPEHPEAAEAVARALIALDPALPLVLLDGPAADAAEAVGAVVAREAFVDADYSPDGRLLLHTIATPHPPEEVAARAVSITRGRLITQDGELPVRAHTICLHGDAPGAPEIGRAVRAALEAAGVAVLPLPATLAACAAAGTD